MDVVVWCSLALIRERLDQDIVDCSQNNPITHSRNGYLSRGFSGTLEHKLLTISCETIGSISNFGERLGKLSVNHPLKGVGRYSILAGCCGMSDPLPEDFPEIIKGELAVEMLACSHAHLAAKGPAANTRGVRTSIPIRVQKTTRLQT